VLAKLPPHRPEKQRRLPEGITRRGFPAQPAKIYLARECLAEYPLPADGVSNQRFSPPELPTPPCQPKNRRYPSTEEEKRLRALDPEVSRYLDFVVA
jgi:hypothetical protein